MYLHEHHAAEPEPGAYDEIIEQLPLSVGSEQ
jgi:hypothetical protein